MRRRFSERIGLVSKKTELDKNMMSNELRNSLWTVITEIYIECSNSSHGTRLSPRAIFYRALWVDFFKRPIDELSFDDGYIFSDKPKKFLRQWFFESPWNEVYDLIQFLSDSNQYDTRFRELCNEYLKRELSAYRFVDKDLVEINSEEEIREIETALNIEDKFAPVKLHFATALKGITNSSPDYRNSIKESISAVESCCNILLNKNMTLGQALKEIEKQIDIPRGIRNGFSAIYGYASQEDGIRHGATTEINIGIEEARFMLIACSAFVNYLLSKSN